MYFQFITVFASWELARLCHYSSLSGAFSGPAPVSFLSCACGNSQLRPTALSQCCCSTAGQDTRSFPSPLKEPPSCLSPPASSPSLHPPTTGWHKDVRVRIAREVIWRVPATWRIAARLPARPPARPVLQVEAAYSKSLRLIDVDWVCVCGESESEDLDYNRSLCGTDGDDCSSSCVCECMGRGERGVCSGADLYTSYCQRQNGFFLLGLWAKERRTQYTLVAHSDTRKHTLTRARTHTA